MMIKNSSKIGFGLLLALLLMTGCTDRISIAESEMQKIRSQGPQAIEPPPEPLHIENFAYAAHGVPDPFVAKSLRERQQIREQTPSVKPDENRTKEPLESYELTELTYRGKVIAPNGQEFGLVQTPDGRVHDVQIGNYLGTNHGRITGIYPNEKHPNLNRIELIEIVEDVDGQFVEKSNSLIIPN